MFCSFGARLSAQAFWHPSGNTFCLPQLLFYWWCKQTLPRYICKKQRYQSYTKHIKCMNLSSIVKGYLQYSWCKTYFTNASFVWIHYNYDRIPVLGHMNVPTKCGCVFRWWNSEKQRSDAGQYKHVHFVNIVTRAWFGCHKGCAGRSH